MKTTHTLKGHFIILLGSAVHIVSAKPAQAAEWKKEADCVPAGSQCS